MDESVVIDETDNLAIRTESKRFPNRVVLGAGGFGTGVVEMSVEVLKVWRGELYIRNK